MSQIAWPLITIDEAGSPCIEGTRTRVVEIALERIAHHWDADEIQRQHPGLSLAQIHSALAYYYEHQDECDREIQQRAQHAEELRLKLEDHGLQARLRASVRQCR